MIPSRCENCKKPTNVPTDKCMECLGSNLLKSPMIVTKPDEDYFNGPMTVQIGEATDSVIKIKKSVGLSRASISANGDIQLKGKD